MSPSLTRFQLNSTIGTAPIALPDRRVLTPAAIIAGGGPNGDVAVNCVFGDGGMLRLIVTGKTVGGPATFARKAWISSECGPSVSAGFVGHVHVNLQVWFVLTFASAVALPLVPSS